MHPKKNLVKYLNYIRLVYRSTITGLLNFKNHSQYKDITFDENVKLNFAKNEYFYKFIICNTLFSYYEKYF